MNYLPFSSLILRLRSPHVAGQVARVAYEAVSKQLSEVPTTGLVNLCCNKGRSAGPQYRYAYDEDKQTVDVLELPQIREEIGGPFFCIGRSNLLIAKTKGKKDGLPAPELLPSCLSYQQLLRFWLLSFLRRGRPCTNLVHHTEPVL